MFFVLFSVKFVAFPSRFDAIFNSVKNIEDIHTEMSGSIGHYINGKCQQTHSNMTLNDNRIDDWCSNIIRNNEGKPWIQYSIKNKAMQLTGYSMRAGCCYTACCCVDNDVVDSCCCEPYSFSLYGSNDNITWKLIHRVEKDNHFYICEFKTYEFAQTEPFTMVKLVSDAPYPGCTYCIAINQIELYGKLTNDMFSYISEDDNEEAVSIIGKVKSNE